MKVVEGLEVSSQPSSTSSRKRTWFGIELLLLGACLILALAVRVWFVVHTKGIIEGDEALVGIQAENILRGERPIYFYAQPYMGSLEAYFLALIFAVVGPSTWALRSEPILLSLVVVWLTWKLAGSLADLAHLPAPARLCFMTVAALLAAFPPSYDLVLELRTYGGYIEVFIVMLLLLNAALRLTQRWHAGATRRELTWRWVVIGFLVGLGLWIYPLVVVAVLAVALWVLGYCAFVLLRILRRRAQARKQEEKPPALITPLLDLLCSITALPGFLLGFAPGLYWGIQHHWENITYLLQNGGMAALSERLTTIAHVTSFYQKCTALRVIGGALPTEPGVTKTTPMLSTPVLVTGLACLALLLAMTLLAFVWRAPLLIQVRRLAALPLVFAGSAALIFCTSKISEAGLVKLCGPSDWVGRYATPLMLVLPFWYATVLTSLFLCCWKLSTRQIPVRARSLSFPGWLARVPWRKSGAVAIIAVLLALQVQTQVSIYSRVDSDLTFQTSGCVFAPVDNDPIIAYLQKKHIHYVWTNGWVGNPITFESNTSIIAIDARIVTTTVTVNRIPAYTDAVLRADRPSVMLLVNHDQPYPGLLYELDKRGITYEVARFLSSPRYRVDVMVVTPLNRPIPLSILNVRFRTC